VRILKGRVGCRIRDLAFSPDGATLATIAGKGKTVALWDAARGKRRGRLRGPDYWLSCLAFAPGGGRLVAGGGGSVWVWDLSAPDQDPRHVNCYTGPVLCTAFVPGEDSLAVGVDEWTSFHVLVRPLDGRAAAKPLPGTGGKGGCLAFSPAGKLLAAGHGTGKVVRLWDLAVRPATTLVLEQPAPVYSVAFAPDGATLAVACGWDVALWDLPAPGQPVAPVRRALLKGHRKLVSRVAFSPDGRTLLSSSHDGTARLWDVPAAAPRAALAWELGPLHAAAFASDGMRAAAGGAADVVVWDVE
jgi:WD40 repeat protein